MNPSEWQHYYLLISFCVGRENTVILSDSATQEQFFEKALGYTAFPSHVNALRISEEVFERLEPTFRKNGSLIEGD